MDRYKSNGNAEKKKQQQQLKDQSDSILQNVFEGFSLKEFGKQIGIVLLISIISIITIKILVPPEFIIFIKDSKTYRMIEIVFVAVIFILTGRLLIAKGYSTKPGKYGFSAKKFTKEQFQRETLRTTKTEIDKLMQSKEYLKWKESSNNRQNGSYKESVVDQDDQIIFSDEDSND